MNMELEKHVLSLPVRATEIQVNNQATLTIANEFLLGIKALEKEINATFDPIIDATNKAHKESLAHKKKFSDPIKAARLVIDPKISAYLEHQEGLRREAEEKARRIEWERQQVERQAALKAFEAEAKGNAKEAKEIIEESLTRNQIASPPPIIPEKPKTEGISMRDDWDFEVIDSTVIPREYLIPDEHLIRRVVKSMKDKTNIPGIRAYAKKTISAKVPFA